MIVIRDVDDEHTGIRAVSPDVRLSVRPDRVLGERVLVVDYPEQSGPASRDVWTDAANRNWTAGRAVAFRVNPDRAIRLSVSFLDAAGVAYTAWADLEAGVWQQIELPFAEIRPNPYFQPPGADPSAPLDVSNVARIGFAPQTDGPGHLAITRFTVVN